MTTEFDGKLVIVTGAAGVLGRAVAEEFRAKGASLALLDLDLDRLHPCYGEGDANTFLKAVDLNDAGAVRKTVSEILQTYNRIDVLCNVAGGFQMGPGVYDTPLTMWQRMMDMNVHSMLHIVQAVVPTMLTQGAGKIVSVGAGAALKAGAYMGAYAASKSAVLRLTEALSAEVREKGINVNCVLPSILDTPANRVDMPGSDFSRWVSPSDLAAVIRFLSSSEARAIHGVALPVTGLV